MGIVLAFLAAYAVGVSQNATYDFISKFLNKFRKKNINFEELFINSFFDALDLYLDNYKDDDIEYILNIKTSFKKDSSKVLKCLSVLPYVDYGMLSSSLENRKFEKLFANEISKEFNLTNLYIHNSLKSLEFVIGDMIKIFRFSVISRISERDSTRMILLQSLKIDQISNLIYEVKDELFSKNELISIIETNQQIFLFDVTNILKQYNDEYHNNKSSIDKILSESEWGIISQDITRILKAKGFRITKIDENNIDIIAISSGIFSSKIAVKISVNESPIDIDEILSFKFHFSRTKANIGYFISKNGFSSASIEEAEVNNQIKLFTYSEFLNGLVDFDDYIKSIINKYENTDLFIKGLYQKVLGYKDLNNQNIDLQDYLFSALNDHVKNKHFALLSDYGIGKSTFCFHLFYLLAKKYSDNIFGNKIPILISLGNYERVADIDSLIVHSFQKYGVDISHPIFLELQRMGRFIFILDGFDEMSLRPDKLNVYKNLKEIEKLTNIGDNYLIISSRTHFFKDKFSEELLNIYDLLYINNWHTSQINRYLNLSLGSDWLQIKDKIVESASLMELSKTPLFLEMITKATNELITQEINVNSLFEIFTNKWIYAQDYRSRMSCNEKSTFMSELASLLYYNKRFSVHYTELREVVRYTFNLQVIEDVDYFDNDTRTCSFLTRDNDGFYRFSHRAFMDFFIAKLLVVDIQKIAIKLRQGLQIQDHKFLLTKLSNEIYIFISQSKINSELFLDLIKETKKNSFKDILYLGSNSVTILKHRKFNFSNQDFSNCILVDADFGGSNLSYVNFKNSNLYTANFNNSKLDNATFENAELKYASIKEAIGFLDIYYNNRTNICLLAGLLKQIHIIDLNNITVIGEIQGHSDDIWTMNKIINNSFIVTGGRDNSVRLWDTDTMELIRSFDGHFDNVWSIKSSKQGNMFASCSSDRQIKIWKFDNSAPLHVLTGHKDEVRDISFIGENFIVSCSIDNTLKIWDLQTESIVSEYYSKYELHALDISHDEKYIILGDQNGFLTCLELPNLNLVWNEKIHTGVVRTVAFCSDDYRIVSGGGDKKVIISQVNNKQTKIICKHKELVNKVHYIPLVDIIVSVGFDGIIYIYDMRKSILNEFPINPLIYDGDNHFSCKNLNLKNANGLNKERYNYLLSKGAIT